MSKSIPVKNVATPAILTGPIHTRRFTGFFRYVRMSGAGSLMLLFFGTSWLNWGQRQAVLWDLSNRQFYIGGYTFWPQDLNLLAALLIIAAFGLFLASTLIGRVWCGYTCPQSIWTWLFMWVEQLTEGDRYQRIKLGAAPWSLTKLWRRVSKHSLWLALSLATAMAFVGYFTPIRDLYHDLWHGQLSLTSSVWLLVFTSFTYINAGWLREKVCTHMCPYARFQSVMFDQDTLVVSYDRQRGEPRGSLRSDSIQSDSGDCIDCTLCVQVCPTGIDIREGLQLDCLSCGACIDICNSVMTKIGSPTGLIRYSSERALNGGQTHWLRPRTVAYASVFITMLMAFAWAIDHRPLVSLSIAKDRNSLFQETNEGQLINSYTLRIINKTQQAHQYQLQLNEHHQFQLQTVPVISLAAGEVMDLPISIVSQYTPLTTSSIPIHLHIQALDDPQIHIQTASTFLTAKVNF